MKRRRGMLLGTSLLLAMFGSWVGSGIPGRAQQNPVPSQGTSPLGRHQIDSDAPPVGLAEQQARAQNSERQKRLVADTDRLLALATELKTQVDKTNKDILSVDVIKKAEEIEKLARSVKERMKG